jgi:hypothetical protein
MKCQKAMKQLAAAPGLFVMSRLQVVKDWFARTPVLLVLREGQVVRVGKPESLLVDIVENVRKP